MIEYLFNAIRATAGKELSLAAKITSESGAVITEGCYVHISAEDGSHVAKIDGSLVDNVWQFNIPADATKGLKGRYWYCICTADADLCFKQPMYLV
jgi:hypothetical protein